MGKKTKAALDPSAGLGGAPPTLKPAQALQELALTLHRANANLYALAQLSHERLAVEREQLEIARTQLRLTQEARDLIGRAQSEGAAASATGQAMLERLLAGALRGPEERTHSAPALGPCSAPEPAGLVCR